MRAWRRLRRNQSCGYRTGRTPTACASPRRTDRRRSARPSRRGRVPTWWRQSRAPHNEPHVSSGGVAECRRRPPATRCRKGMAGLASVERDPSASPYHNDGRVPRILSGWHRYHPSSRPYRGAQSPDDFVMHVQHRTPDAETESCRSGCSHYRCERDGGASRRRLTISRDSYRYSNEKSTNTDDPGALPTRNHHANLFTLLK